MSYLFKPNFKIIKKNQGLVSIEDLNQEAGMFSASPEFVRKHGGKLSNMILDQVPEEFMRDTLEKGLFPNIDIRIHRLYPNDIPAYPGWHCDESKRETFFGQSHQDRVPVNHSCIFMISSDPNGVSNTEFLNQELEVEDFNLEGFDLWKRVDQSLILKKINTININDNEWVIFNEFNLHRVSPAKNPGYRVFMRLSFWEYQHDGSISKFEQVYKTKW